MIATIPSNQRFHFKQDWLDTYFHFSFSDYYDPQNIHWGALRVFNDDTIAGGGGFDLHPHRDMEIITIMREGELRHRDSLGNTGVIRPGELQVMTAGSGIQHAEFNNSPTDPAKLLQIWIMPRNKGNTPRWEQKQFDPAAHVGKLLPVVSSGDLPGTLAIDQDAQIYLSTLKTGNSVTHTIQLRRKAYLFVMDGQINVNSKELGRGDQARIADETELKISASQNSELILIDLP